MKKEIRQLSEDGNTVQITIADERWYIKTEYNDDESIKSMKEYPSVTWIGNYCPKGVEFYKWLASKGWEEAEIIKEQGGNRGSKVHLAISDLLLGNKVSMEDEYPNKKTGEPEQLSLEEYEGIMSFEEWFKETKPKTIANEISVFNDEHMYAGTVDYICEIDGVRTLIDFKTSARIYNSTEAQVSAYKYALPKELEVEQLGILQLNYKRNKIKKWKYTSIEYDFDLFLSAKKFWAKECENTHMFQKDYPTSITLSL